MYSAVFYSGVEWSGVKWIVLQCVTAVECSEIQYSVLTVKFKAVKCSAL